MAAIFLALLTLMLSLFVPALAVEKVTRTENQLKQNVLLLTQSSNAFNLEQQGKEYYDTGRFAEAVQVWQQAANAYGQNEDGKNRNLINKAKALQSLGLYPEACSQIIQTFGIFNVTCKQFIDNQNIHNQFIKYLEEKPEKKLIFPNQTIGLRLLGEILQRLGELNLSQKVLEISLRSSEQYPEEKSAVLLSLGNIERANGNKIRERIDYEQIINIIRDKSENNALELYKKTFQHYEQALKYYESAASQAPYTTQIQAELNQLSLLVDRKVWWTEQITKSKKYDWPELQEDLNNKIKNLLPKINAHLSNLPQSREAVYAQINFTHSLIRYKSTSNEDYLSQPEIAKLLSTAIQTARSLGDKQAEAAALSHLARLYELQIVQTEKLTEQNKYDLSQAENLIQDALRLSSNINVDNRQILYRQRRQLGRILKTQGNIEGALASYAEAWNILESLRADLVSNADNQFSFRQDAEPVYREFIDVLLQADNSQVDLTNSKKLVLLNNITDAINNNTGAYNLDEKTVQKKPLIYIARLVMQSLQLAELDNFFQEPCSPPVTKPEQIDNIDRDAAVIYPIILENRLEVILSQFGQVPRHYPISITDKEVKNTLEDLANIIYNKTSVEPYSALNIQSIKGIEESEKKLYLALNKQKIWKHSQKVYDWLIKPLETQLIQGQVKTLVFVLDRPFQTIPIAALYDGKNYLVEKYNIVLNLGQQLKNPKPLPSKNIKILAAGVSEKTDARGQEFEAIEDVEKELTGIESLGAPTEKLLNQDFNKKNFQAEIKSFPNIVHLATHGVFSSNREQTFILTGDKTGGNSIDIDDFQNWLNPKDKIRDRTIELLVLSACETALGDDRAALGIAGVALRSGASSTVATLWPVVDAAAAELMVEFYRNLINPDKKVSRAQALRNAQLSLLKNGYTHPYYWAPFILVGNWL